ncbi:hypothetical protein QSV34_00035 [Porticoccus sp. W117]|uniref:hypothetical protein n=1 Tax=Porticoccus sp. W117 TaxID=3054777 RepID=UPI0025923205|nr:hypothetical protein [Porticoccus sp. W117]MDM3869729.1 hypothetical protein [Porticoccus sp. W117]
MKKGILAVLLTLVSFAVLAGGWTHYSASDSKGTIENIEVIRAQGFMIFGDLGDPADCGRDGYLWVAFDHPQYEQLYSMALTAFTAGKKIQAYAHSCTDVGWHGGSFSTLTGAGGMYIRH